MPRSRRSKAHGGCEPQVTFAVMRSEGKEDDPTLSWAPPRGSTGPWRGATVFAPGPVHPVQAARRDHQLWPTSTNRRPRLIRVGAFVMSRGGGHAAFAETDGTGRVLAETRQMEIQHRPDNGCPYFPRYSPSTWKCSLPFGFPLTHTLRAESVRQPSDRHEQDGELDAETEVQRVARAEVDRGIRT